MTRAFNIEGLVRLQNYMGGKTLSDAQFFAVLNADVVEMIDGEESTTKRRYFRIAENDGSITFSCILGSSQQQMVVTKATKQLDVTTTEIGGGITPGSITTEMLADGAVTGTKIKDFNIGPGKLVDNSITSSKIVTGAVTSEKLAEGLDVSGLFFILPEGTQFPYTLTEDDKVKITNARFILLKGATQPATAYIRSIDTAEYQGDWYALGSVSQVSRITIAEGQIQTPRVAAITDLYAVRFTTQTLTAKKKKQVRTNIGAAEDPNTSGDPQATLEEPPVVDGEPIP